MDAERFKELVNKAGNRVHTLEAAINHMKSEITGTKSEIQHCRIDLMNAKNKKPPSYNKAK